MLRCGVLMGGAKHTLEHDVSRLPPVLTASNGLLKFKKRLTSEARCVIMYKKFLHFSLDYSGNAQLKHRK
jgi:hypothetical protein